MSGEAEPNAPAAADIEPAAAAVIEDEMAPAEAAAETGEPTAAVADDYAATTPGSVAASALADGDEASSGQEPGLEPGAAGDDRPRRDRHRVSHSNALGMLIERHFGDPASPCRSYSDLERHSGISREALSRYVTARPDRRRSPTIDTLVAIADAMHLSLESVARAAAASVKGVQLPPEQEQAEREEVLGTLVAALTPEQFGAVVELLRQLRPAPGAS